MRILLINPYDPNYRDMLDLGLGYLASSLQKEGHTVSLAIKSDELNPPERFLELLHKEKYDIYGLRVMSMGITAAKETIRLIRIVNPEALIILGGAQVFSEPDSIFQLIPEADYGFCGESEISIVEFVRKISSGSISETDLKEISGLVWRNGSKTVVNEPAIIEDLDSLKFPAWDLMRPDVFKNIPFNGTYRRFPVAPMIITRGCPFKCTFCASERINGYKVRSRSADNVVEEIKMLTKDYGIKEIQFWDSNCAHPNGPLREILKRIIDEKIDITWSAPSGIRPDSIDEELTHLMKKSGCFQVNVGLESGSRRILKRIKKGLPRDLGRKSIKMLADAGIEIIGFFMLGFPGETHEEIEQTISYAMELPLTGAAFYIYNPLPGTPLYKDIFGDQIMGTADISRLDYLNYKNNLSEVPYDQLRKIVRNAYLKFHLRPRIMKHVIRNFSSLDKMKHISKRVFSLLKN